MGEEGRKEGRKEGRSVSCVVVVRTEARVGPSRSTTLGSMLSLQLQSRGSEMARMC